MKRTILSLLLSIFVSAAFSQPVKPHTFSPLDPVSSAKMNANFDTIYQWGSVASAAIELHKADTAAHGATGGVVGLTKTQSLTNKTLDSSNSIDGAAIKTGMVAEARIDPEIARGIDVSVQIMSHEMLTQAHGAMGEVVGTTNTQTLTNKTIGTGSIWNGNAISDAYLNTAYSNAAMSGHRNSITSADTRSTNYEPDDRDRGLYADFKGNSTDGLSDGATYHGVLTFRPYGSTTDMSGGYPFQLGFTENTNVWLRKGASTTAWGTWYKLFHSGHTIPAGNIDSAICRGSELTTHAGATTGVHGVGAGAVVGTTLTQTLTNKSISGEQINSGTVADARIDAAIARDSEVTSAVSTHAGLTATHGVTGAVVGTTNTQTISNKTFSNTTHFTEAIGAADDVRKGLMITDTTAMAAGVGGQLGFRYKYTTAGDYTEGALIRMYKLNATTSDYSSGLKFQVRNTGAGLSTKMVLDPDGQLWNGNLANKYWHAGNDGSSSGLDADLLEGYHAVTANAVSTIPVRDSNGDITTRLFKSTYAEQTTAPATTADIAFRNDTSDNYIRFMSADAFKNWMINSKIGVVQTSAPASPVNGDIWVE